MKKKLCTILFLLISISLFSQQEVKVNPKNDFGINVNAVLNKVIFNKINDEITNPFPDQFSVLTFRHFVSPKVALKLGIGYDQFYRKDSIFNTFSGILVEEDKFRFLAIHFGIQKTIVDSKKVKLNVGWDWFFRNEYQEKTRDDFFFGGGIALEQITFTEHIIENNVGFGIPFGIQFFLNDHIFISTELSLEVFQTFSKDKSSNNGSRDDEYRDNTDILNLHIRPPLSMFVHYRF